MRLFLSLTLVLSLAAVLPAQAQELELSYPAIQGAGGIVLLPDAVHQPDPDRDYQILFDVTGAGEPDEPAKGLDRVARFINLYASGGVPPQRMKLAAVMHGDATRTVLSDDAYRRHFGTPNPDAALFDQLRAAGVEIYVCGQALAHRGFKQEEVRPDVQVALAALTVVANLSAEGYTVLPF